jgi:hypothetical protein
MTACVPVNTKKYQTRKSPPYHAKDCKGAAKKGKNGKVYVSAPDSRGVYKWVVKSKGARATQKQKTQKKHKTQRMKTYMILDNGSNTFSADVSPSHVAIYLLEENGADGKKVIDTAHTRVFVGDNDLRIGQGVAPKGMYPGNSLLIQVRPGSYIFAGQEIYSFSTVDGEEILAYYSPVGNSAVPYPYAVGERHTYFMLEMEYVPNELLDLTKDAYGQFYGFTVKDEAQKAVIQGAAKKFTTKLLQKRNRH